MTTTVGTATAFRRVCFFRLSDLGPDEFIQQIAYRNGQGEINQDMLQAPGHQERS